MSVVEEVYVPVERRQALTAFVLAGLAIAGALAIHWQTSWSLVSTWLRSDTFAHGMLVVPASLYLMWSNRRALSGLEFSVAPVGLAALAVASAVWVLARIADVLVVQQFALVAMVPLLAWVLLGRVFVRTMVFPLAFLIFAVPFGERLIPHLMEFTASFTVFALELTGIPVYREGLYFSIPSGDFEVAKACSGIRYLIGSVSLGCLYAYLMYRSFRRRLIFIVIAAIVPVLANGLRAYLIVLIAHLSNMKFAVGVDHLVYGWLFFGLVMFLLFWIGRFFREDEMLPAGAPHGWAHAPRGPAPTRILALAVPALAIVFFGPVFYDRVDAAAESLSADYAPQLPAALGGWNGPATAEPDWRPRFVGAQSELAGYYRRNSAGVWLHVAGYQRQEQGAELINAENRMYDPDVWRVSGEGVRTLSGGTAFAVRELKLRSATDAVLVWYWYRSRGEPTVSEISVKWSEVTEVLAGRADSAALVAVAAVDGLETDAAALLEAFIDVHLGAIDVCIDGTTAPGCAP